MLHSSQSHTMLSETPTVPSGPTRRVLVENPPQVRHAKAAAALAMSSVILIFAGLTGGSSPAAAVDAVDLGTAETYSVLGGSAVTNTGPTVLSGDLGVSPGDSITGFTGPPDGSYLGTLHQDDMPAAQAQSDLTIAYDNAAGQAPDVTLASPELGGLTLISGVYKNPTDVDSMQLTGTLTLDAQGNSDAVFIFQIASTLTTAEDSTVSLINGADPCNVFWQIGSSATLGTDTTFVGTIMALTSVTVTTGATIQGRALARNGAVTLDTNTITTPDCSGATTGTATTGTATTGTDTTGTADTTTGTDTTGTADTTTGTDTTGTADTTTGSRHHRHRRHNWHCRHDHRHRRHNWHCRHDHRHRRHTLALPTPPPALPTRPPALPTPPPALPTPPPALPTHHRHCRHHHRHCRHHHRHCRHHWHRRHHHRHHGHRHHGHRGRGRPRGLEGSRCDPQGPPAHGHGRRRVKVQPLLCHSLSDGRGRRLRRTVSVGADLEALPPQKVVAECRKSASTTHRRMLPAQSVVAGWHTSAGTTRRRRPVLGGLLWSWWQFSVVCSLRSVFRATSAASIWRLRPKPATRPAH